MPGYGPWPSDLLRSGNIAPSTEVYPSGVFKAGVRVRTAPALLSYPERRLDAKRRLFPCCPVVPGSGLGILARCPQGHQDVTEYHAATCQHPGKRPLGRWKVWQSRLPTLEELADQWELVPRSNVGVVMGQVSGLIGIDVDGEEGQRLLQEASGQEGTPVTLSFRTARGIRLLYGLEPGTVIRSWAIRKDGSEVKVLGEGALTVMPPSRHVSGKMYQWNRRRRLAVAPEWTLRRPEGRQKARRPGSQVARTGALIPEGRRNETLFRIGCAMRGRGMDEDEILAAIRVVNRNCVPPLEEGELRTIARSVGRYDTAR